MRATRRMIAGAIALALTISCAGDRGPDAPNVARAPEAQAPATSGTQPLAAVTRKTHKPKGAGAPDFGFMVTPADYTANYSDQPVFRLKTDSPPRSRPGCRRSSSRSTSGRTRSSI